MAASSAANSAANSANWLTVDGIILMFPGHIQSGEHRTRGNIGMIPVYVSYLLTLPVAVASGEWSFSALKLIKTYMRSTMSGSQDWPLHQLSLMFAGLWTWRTLWLPLLKPRLANSRCRYFAYFLKVNLICVLLSMLDFIFNTEFAVCLYVDCKCSNKISKYTMCAVAYMQHL